MAETLLRLINEQHGTAFILRGRYPAGEQGAFALSGSKVDHSERFVLKWSSGTTIPDGLRQAMSVTQRLRVVGYPAPRFLFYGVAPSLGAVYSVQEELPGDPLGERLDRSVLDRLLELNSLQRGQALVGTTAWPRPIADPVLRGGDGYCLLDPLCSYSRATAALLGILQRLAAAGDYHPPAGDVVHFDFQGSNILIAGDEISGVVDWEGCCAGDRAFDLATLFFYAGESAEADQVERLWRLLLERTGPQLLGVYLAHLILRQVDWSIRFHDRASVERWLGRADDVLRRLWAAFEGDVSV